MTNTKKKQAIGLIGLYVLLLITSSLIQQVKYYGMVTVILIAMTIIILIILWRYLLRHRFVSVTWGSMTYEAHTHRSERLFLCSLVTLVSPVLRFHEITRSDVIVTVIAFTVAIVGFILNERRLTKKRNKS